MDNYTFQDDLDIYYKHDHVQWICSITKGYQPSGCFLKSSAEVYTIKIRDGLWLVTGTWSKNRGRKKRVQHRPGTHFGVVSHDSSVHRGRNTKIRSPKPQTAAHPPAMWAPKRALPTDERNAWVKWLRLRKMVRDVAGEQASKTCACCEGSYDVGSMLSVQSNDHMMLVQCCQFNATLYYTIVMIACTSMLRDRYYSLSQTIWIWQNPGFLNPLPGWSEKLKVRRIWSLACGHLSSKADPTSVAIVSNSRLSAGGFSVAEPGGSIEKLWIYWRNCREPWFATPNLVVFFRFPFNMPQPIRGLYPGSLCPARCLRTPTLSESPNHQKALKCIPWSQLTTSIRCIIL